MAPPPAVRPDASVHPPPSAELFESAAEGLVGAPGAGAEALRSLPDVASPNAPDEPRLE